jgi:hypothetical protein
VGMLEDLLSKHGLGLELSESPKYMGSLNIRKRVVRLNSNFSEGDRFAIAIHEVAHDIIKSKYLKEGYKGGLFSESAQTLIDIGGKTRAVTNLPPSAAEEDVVNFVADNIMKKLGINVSDPNIQRRFSISGEYFGNNPHREALANRLIGDIHSDISGIPELVEKPAPAPTKATTVTQASKPVDPIPDTPKVSKSNRVVEPPKPPVEKVVPVSNSGSKVGRRAVIAESDNVAGQVATHIAEEAKTLPSWKAAIKARGKGAGTLLSAESKVASRWFKAQGPMLKIGLIAGGSWLALSVLTSIMRPILSIGARDNPAGLR